MCARPDGSWRFDYTVFDRYVEFAMGGGITRQINCYSLLTWSGRLFWTKAAMGDQRLSSCDPAAGEFADYWGPFLREVARLPNDHWGSHRLLVDDFVKACVSGEPPPDHVWAAACYLLSGLVAPASAVRGGVQLDVTNLGGPPGVK